MSIEVRLHEVGQPFICHSHFSPEDYHPQGSMKLNAVPKMKKGDSSKDAVNVNEKCEIQWKDENDNVEAMDMDSVFSDEISQFEPISSASSMNSPRVNGDILNYHGILVDCDSLLELFQFCPFCTRECTINTKIDGACLKVQRNCTCVEGNRIPEWSGSKVLQTKAEGKREKLQSVNLDLCTCTVSSGSFFKAMEKFFDAMEVPFISETTYHRHKKNYVSPVIDIIYKEQHEQIMDILSERVQQGEQVNLIGDGQYDSRGYSAIVCRYIILDSHFNFVLNATILRKNRGEASARLEPAAHRLALNALVKELRELSGNQMPVESFTSDRHRSIANSMKREFGGIRHYFDAWHFFETSLWTLSRRRN